MAAIFASPFMLSCRFFNQTHSTLSYHAAFLARVYMLFVGADISSLLPKLRLLGKVYPLLSLQSESIDNVILQKWENLIELKQKPERIPEEHFMETVLQEKLENNKFIHQQEPIKVMRLFKGSRRSWIFQLR